MKKAHSRDKPQGLKNPNFNRIMRGLEEATAYARGEADLKRYRVHVPETVDVAAVRAGLGSAAAQCLVQTVVVDRAIDSRHSGHGINPGRPRPPHPPRPD